jgi:hypothetical protein
MNKNNKYAFTITVIILMAIVAIYTDLKLVPKSNVYIKPAVVEKIIVKPVVVPLPITTPKIKHKGSPNIPCDIGNSPNCSCIETRNGIQGKCDESL